jgi:hypothetical protein
MLAYLSFRRCCLSVHFFLWFEPLPGKEMEFRDELLRVVERFRRS